MLWQSSRSSKSNLQNLPWRDNLKIYLPGTFTAISTACYCLVIIHPNISYILPPHTSNNCNMLLNCSAVRQVFVHHVPLFYKLCFRQCDRNCIVDIKGTVRRYWSHAITCYFTACEIIIRCTFTRVCRIELHDVKLKHPSKYSEG